MTIKKFIEKLEKIAKKHGDNFIKKKAIVITDQK